MGYITLKLKKRLTLHNYLKLIIIGAFIRVVYPFIPISEIIGIIITIPAFLEIMISFLLNKFSEDKIPTINYASSSIVPYGNGNGDGNGNGNGIGNGNGNGIGNGIGNGNGIGIVSNNNLNLNGNLAQPISEEYILSQKETITRSYGDILLACKSEYMSDPNNANKHRVGTTSLRNLNILELSQWISKIN